uniref:hypothetical protein n=1 Tax=Stylonema alsidii TaxID=35155 RepID=UPI001FCDDD1D|nr:hypothetical protein MW559_pgp010 [Stylonema alsidii]UNJ15282.1 hypothetical protein [Stylonema alsidii]
MVVKSLFNKKLHENIEVNTTTEYLEKLNNILNDKIHSITLENISDFYTFRKLNSSFGFSLLENNQTNHARKSIISLINKLRLSGYFSQIHLESKTYKNTIIFFLELKLNPILNEIEFTNTQSLLIDHQKLKLYSYNLIGYPNSLTQLKLLSHQIKHWYKCRGYQWVHVKIYDQEFSTSNKVYYDIIEGILDRITYKICPLIGHEINKNVALERFIPIDLVNEILYTHLKNGQPPTLFNIEKAMLALKDTRFFYNFYYDVNFIHLTKNIELIIHFVPYRDHEIQAIIDKIIQKISLTHLYEKRIEELIKKDYLPKHNLYKTSLFLSQDLQINSIDNLTNRYIYGIKNQYTAENMLLNFNIQNLLYDIELGLDENFHLNQYHSQIYFFENLHYFRHNFDFINFTFQEKNTSSQFDFSYDSPLNVNKKLWNLLATRIFNNLTLVKSENHQFTFNNIISKKRLIKHTSEFKRKGIDFVFQRKFIRKENISSILGSRIISYANLNYKRSNLLFNLLKEKYSTLKQDFIFLEKNFINKKEYFKFIIQKFKIWNFRIQWPHIDNLYHPTIGYFTQFDFVQLRPDLNLINSTEKITQNRTYDLIFFKHISYFRNRPLYPSSPYHLMLFKIFVGQFYGQSTLFSLPDRLRYQKLQTRQAGYFPNEKNKNSLGEYLIEYHFRLSKYTNPVLSLKLLHDSTLFEEYPFPHVQGEFFYSNRLDLFPVSSGKYLSIGWEFRTMISQIPPIRIEFIQEIPGKGKIYLRVIPYLY